MSVDIKAISVLVVDDERDMRIIIKSALEEMGFADIQEAQDPKGAYHIVQYAYKKIDLILCDWNLPGCTGIEFLRQLHGAGHFMPFIIISGRGDSESVCMAAEYGVAGYLRKPFSPEHLQEKICAALQRGPWPESL